MTDTLPSDACPSHERLGAYADGMLTGDEHRAIQRHLADCDDCRELVAEAVHLHPEGVPALAPVIPFWRRRKVQTFGGGILALAAALILVVRVSPELNLFGGPTAYEELVAAVGNNRVTEGRLTGGFGYGPMRPVTRGASGGEFRDDIQVLAAIARIREQAAKSGRPENDHALGVALLLTGEHDEAIAALDRAARSRRDAAAYSDLAAAYLARAQAGGTARDLDAGLDAVERALVLEPRLPEALFNRAWLFDVVGRPLDARRAWSDYLAVDGSSPWARDVPPSVR